MSSRRIAILATTSACCGGAGPPPAPRTTAPAEVAVGTQPVDVIAADVDGDGRLDLISADGGGRTLSLRLQRGDAWAAADAIATPFEPHLVGAGDVDADGRLDLVASGHDSGQVGVWLGDGGGGFRAAPGSPFTAVSADKPHNHGLVVGDLDADGDADAVVIDQEAKAAAVLLAVGGGSLERTAGSPIALGAQAYPLALGHVDGDARLDLVVPLLDGHVAVLLGDGAGGFAMAPGSPHATARDRPYGVAIGDVDGDGAADVIAAHDDTDEISVLLGDGRGGLRDAAGSPRAIGARIWRPVVVDLDGDGRLDVIGAAGDRLVILRGDGHGAFEAPRHEAGGGWHVIAADLDADGRVDLVSSDANAGVLRIWRGGVVR